LGIVSHRAGIEAFMRALVLLSALVALQAHAFEDEECVEELAPPPPRREEPLLAVKALGGVSGLVNSSDAPSDQPGFSGMIGAEFRLTRWLALRSDLDFRPNGISWDAAGLKLRAPWFLSPYISVGATLGFSNGHLALGPVGAAGLDLHLGRHFFLEVEGAYRVSPGEQLRRGGQASLMAGLGWAFL